jgi:uncharacterized protein
MTRLLFWIALIILVVMAVRSKVRAALAARGYQTQDGHSAGTPASGPAHAHSRIAESERMSSCAQCGLYFPSSEAVHDGGRDYCSQAHARQAAAARPE